MKPQSDFPTLLKKSFMLAIVMAGNLVFILASIVFRAVLLQAKVLDTDIFVKLSEDVRKPAVV